MPHKIRYGYVISESNIKESQSTVSWDDLEETHRSNIVRLGPIKTEHFWGLIQAELWIFFALEVSEFYSIDISLLRKHGLRLQ